MDRQPTSILEGVAPIFDLLLGCTAGQAPCFKSRTSYLRLDVSRLDGSELVRTAYNQVCRNLASRAVERNGSAQNWRWEKQLKMVEGNPSREKQLEKAIARHTAGDWVNQVPTSSGVMGSGERHRNIDLIRRIAPGRFEFVEWKVESDTPLSAAVEIVCYGLVYLCSRTHAATLGYAHHNELLRAEEVGLRVLAPSSFYADRQPREQLRVFESQLNSGLAALGERECARLGVRMCFRFEQFPVACAWSSKEEVLGLLDRRWSVYADNRAGDAH